MTYSNWRSHRRQAIFRYRRKLIRRIGGLLLAVLIGFVSCAPLRMAIARFQHPDPQAILTLGGPSSRELFTARFAQQHPELEIWVSTGIDNHEALRIFEEAGINLDRVHLDRRAIDTVTNFTTLVSDFKHRHLSHLYVITSDFHMKRASAIATIVLGSRGIAYTPVEVPTYFPPETTLHIARDISRSFMWLLTGRTGASLHPSQRKEHLKPA